MTPSDNHIPINKSAFLFYFAVIIVGIVGALNRYIFVSSNLPFLFLVMIFIAFIFGSQRIPKGITFPIITFFMLIFIVYMYLRWNTDNNSLSQIPLSDWEDYSLFGRIDITDQLIYYGLFISAALIYYNKGKFPFTLWMIISGYILASIIRRSLVFSALKAGYNLSPGFVLFSLIPFVFLINFRNRSKMRFVPHIILAICILWQLLLGARTTSVSLLFFYTCLIAWPIITRNRFNYFATFWGTLIFAIIIPAVYLVLIPTGVLEPINEISKLLFQKRIGTRFNIWSQLTFLILERPLFGFGTECASALFAAPAGVARNNLASHSTYFELMLRLGVSGLILYVAILFGIWRVFWRGRKELAVKVAGSYLISTFIFMSTQQYLIFSSRLWSGFGWIILGIGVGACLRAKRQQFRKRLEIIDHGRTQFSGDNL